MPDSLVVPPNISGPNVSAFFTTKSSSADMNRLLKISETEKAYVPIQKHTDKVVVVDHDLEPKIADAVITNRPRILIGVQVADCVPILMYDGKKKVVAAVHAGWRGTAAGILKNTLNVMADRFYSSPADIFVAIGPSIKGCCYQVGPEVVEGVKKSTGEGTYIIEKGGKYCVDLAGANKRQALSCGIPEQNIRIAADCTFCLPEKYYSYRFAKGTTGRQYGLIGML
ncbi:MAG: peptidoglycan editing factor PgeF [Nitrospirae bacterium]|nr:MAG: peptidoglycan editing factor PgeF [Nitrospirota bacterium]